MKKMTPEIPPVILTIGHSNRKLEVFIRLLQAHSVKHVVDVRTIPRSETIHNLTKKRCQIDWMLLV